MVKMKELESMIK